MGLAQWEAAGMRVRVGNEDVFFVDRRRPNGDPTHLVLHGFPTSSHDWAEVVAQLPDTAFVLFDYPGFGCSVKPDRPYSLFAQADVAEAVAAHLALERVVLVAHDIGDSVAGELLARDLAGRLPFEIEEVLLTNGSIYLDLAHLTDGQRAMLELPDAKLPESLGSDAVAAGLRATFAPGADVEPTILRSMAELVVREEGDRLLPRTARYIEERRTHESRWTGALERHPAPMRVGWGVEDPIADVAMAERLAERRPVQLELWPGVGHYPMVEAPDRVARLLER